MSEQKRDNVTVEVEKTAPKSWIVPDEALFAIDYYIQFYLSDRATQKTFHERVFATGELVPEQWEPQQLEYLRQAANSAYQRLIGIARAGWPEHKQDLMVSYLGDLVSLLDQRFAAEPAAELSIERLLVVASAMEAGPVEAQRGLAMLGGEDRPAAIERAMRQLHDSALGHETAIVLLAMCLPMERREEVIVTHIASSRREDVRLTLLKLLTGPSDEPRMGTIEPLFSRETTEKLVRLGLTDPAPRVRRQAASYAVGLGIVGTMRAELRAGANNDPDELTREVFVAVLEYADRVQRL
jgi:hypothetical protein